MIRELQGDRIGDLLTGGERGVCEGGNEGIESTGCGGLECERRACEVCGDDKRGIPVAPNSSPGPRLILS